MGAAMLTRSVSAALLAVAGVLLLHQLQGSISFGEMLAAAACASLLASAGGSFLRSPRQFWRALFERVRYLVLVPLCGLLMVGLLLFKLAFIVGKILLKAILALALWLIYLISPIDLIPDLIPILGLIDDFVLLATIWVWAASAGAKDRLRASVSVLRPTTAFP